MKTGRNADTKPYLPLYVDDWFSSVRVRVMTTAQRGAFLELLMIQWRSGRIPSDTDQIVRMFPDVPKKQIEEVLEAFADGKNGRLERVREAADAEQQTRSEAARKANSVRWGSKRTPESSGRTPIGSHAEAEADAEAEKKPPSEAARAPLAPAQKKTRKPAEGPSHELIRFWERLWLETRSHPYVVEAKDGVSAAAVVKMSGGDLAECQRRAERLLMNRDGWMVQNASLALLRSRWNQLAVEVIPKPNTTVQRGIDSVEEYLRQNGYDPRMANHPELFDQKKPEELNGHTAT